MTSYHKRSSPRPTSSGLQSITQRPRIWEVCLGRDTGYIHELSTNTRAESAVTAGDSGQIRVVPLDGRFDDSLTDSNTGAARIGSAPTSHGGRYA